MKKLLLFTFSLFLSFKSVYSQCSVQVNDSLLSNYDYVLNATNMVGLAPFQFNWTVTDGNGMTVAYTTNTAGDSLTIDAFTLQNSYGCIIYQLCMTDALNCTTCIGDTSILQVPINCYSSFTSSIVGTNQVAITLNSNIPPFLITTQFMNWTDGQGSSQGMPYMGPGTVVTYTPGPNNTSDQFFLCLMTNLVNGGCIYCDSIPYMTVGISEMNEKYLSIYPNPINQQINIKCDFEIQSLMIISMSGVVVRETASEGKKDYQLDLSEIPNGLYIAEIRTNNGLLLRKLIIKN